MYRAVAALEEYVLISADRQAVEVRMRHADGEWQRTSFGPNEDAVLSTIAANLPIDVIYEDVELA